MNRVEVAIAIVQDEGKILICQRKHSTNFPGYWEFPGGKIEPGETPSGCARREVLEEVGLTIAVDAPLEAIEHQYPDLHIKLHPFLCTVAEGKAMPLQVQQVRWVLPEQLTAYHFPEANVDLIAKIIGIAAQADFANVPPRPSR